jgi:hypothetical protein
LAALALLATACTEKLTSTADCPNLCPGGIADFRDTILTATEGLDSSYAGYVAESSLLSLLVANGGDYGDSRGVVSFQTRGDSVFVKDTARAFTLDSAAIALYLQASDTTVVSGAVELYRLPLSIDSLSSIGAIDRAMTPDQLLATFELNSGLRTGAMRIVLSGADLAKVAFTPADSGRLAVGVRVRSTNATGIRVGAAASGNQGPVVTWYTRVDVADTALTSQIFTRLPGANFTVRNGSAAPDPGLLAVGGYPVSRTFLRFTLPPALRDSVTIIRATLQLTTDRPMFGIPADTATILARPVLALLGPKSPVSADLFDSGFILSGQTDLTMEVAGLVRLWQGQDALPSVMRLELGQEGATFLAPVFRSTRSASGAPTLRITYRRSFAFEGF